jgi:regulator of replication initiation timing
MQNLTGRLSEIRIKVENLLQENRLLKNENESMRDRIEGLERTVELQKNTLSELTEQNKLIKLAKNLTPEDSDTEEMKNKVNELIREIDRCIDLLNE